MTRSLSVSGILRSSNNTQLASKTGFSDADAEKIKYDQPLKNLQEMSVVRRALGAG